MLVIAANPGDVQGWPGARLLSAACVGVLGAEFSLRNTICQPSKSAEGKVKTKLWSVTWSWTLKYFR